MRKIWSYKAAIEYEISAENLTSNDNSLRTRHLILFENYRFNNPFLLNNYGVWSLQNSFSQDY